MTLDGNSAAALVGASVAGFISLGTFAMQVINYFDARRIKNNTKQIAEDGAMREQKLDNIHTQINGRMSELKVKIAKEAFEMGRKYQKENAGTESPDFPKSKVEEFMEEK